MRKMRYAFFLTLLILFISSITYAGGKGATGATFLKIGVGARPMAMGGAYCAISDDVLASCWNPGGLAQIKGKEFSAMHNKWFQDISYEYIGYAQSVGEKSAFGSSITYLHMDELEGRSETGEKTGDFTASDLAFTLSYAREVSENILLGGNLKYISEKIEEENASGFAIDLGSLYETPVENLTLGLALQNIGSEIKFISEGNPLPFNIKLGTAYRLLDKNLTLALDVNFPNDSDTYINVGGEYWFKKIAAARLGYKNGPADVGNGISAGIGFRLIRYGLDYAFVPYADLGDTHRLSFSLKF